MTCIRASAPGGRPRLACAGRQRAAQPKLQVSQAPQAAQRRRHRLAHLTLDAAVLSNGGVRMGGGGRWRQAATSRHTSCGGEALSLALRMAIFQKMFLPKWPAAPSPGCLHPGPRWPAAPSLPPHPPTRPPHPTTPPLRTCTDSPVRPLAEHSARASASASFRWQLARERERRRGMAAIGASMPPLPCSCSRRSS